MLSPCPPDNRFYYFSSFSIFCTSLRISSQTSVLVPPREEGSQAATMKWVAYLSLWPYFIRSYAPNSLYVTALFMQDHISVHPHTPG